MVIGVGGTDYISVIFTSQVRLNSLIKS